MNTNFRDTIVSLIVPLCLFGILSEVSEALTEEFRHSDQSQSDTGVSQPVDIIPLNAPRAGGIFRVKIVGPPDLKWTSLLTGVGDFASGIETASGTIIEIPINPLATGDTLVIGLQSLAGGGSKTKSFAVQP